MADVDTLSAKVTERLAHLIQESVLQVGELTLIVSRENLLQVARVLRNEADFYFNLLVDVCGVDYLEYGRDEWETEEATTTGFERGVDRSFMMDPDSHDSKNAAFGGKTGKFVTPRFASVYHLLSVQNNHRIRLRVPLEEYDLVVPSVVEIWPAANWFEREAFDLFGIMYKGHPDLRRILTDYGFVGHPFRKDFPLIGNVEVRYDAEQKRVVYEPVSITPRILEPKVIRRDNRYEVGE
ncbi:MAG: NADH-quinone oxidoreductase subunit C [Gammaproteobacteria bacterium]|nr:NADH-quinone oxidoreductase subunit C [Gammaproteobacteria bacterium]